MAAGGPKTQRIVQARETYLAALDAWFDEPFKHSDNSPATVMLRDAVLDLRAALREAGVEAGASRP